MGLMDRVKAQADVAVAKAQQGLAQGQTKLDSMQAERAVVRNRPSTPRSASYRCSARNNSLMNRECHQSTEVGVTRQPKHRHQSAEGR
jgi:hypothetical protein